MKKISLLFACLFVTFISFSQSDLGRVKKVNGVEAYIMCEPLRKYKVVVDVNTGLKGESLVTGGLVNKSIGGRVEQFVRRAKKENENIDAIVYTTGKHIVGVKFTDDGTDQTIGVGRVSKMKGYPVFVLCEPLTSYEALESKGGGVKWKSALTAGVINNSIEEDVEKIVNKLQEIKGVEGFYFDGTKRGEAIRFKK